ncbi:MAG: AAA family ATPase [Clostridiales bacterium]|nr:AAA family ATPase [Clostridiales bacterium]
MEIQELIIKKYGKFSDYHMVFQPGINVIYGGNETGKTTIHSFIRAMFFGLNRGRGRAAKTDEYQLRQPWDSPGAFLGSMRFTENGMTYRIDRCFDRSAKPLTLVCETKAVESAHPQEDLDVLLGGMSEAAFLNSVFIPQARCETDEALAQELRNYMINSDHSMDSEIDVTQSLQVLRKKKKQLEQQQKKEDAALEEKIARAQEKEELLRQELDLLRRQAEVQRQGTAQRGSRNSEKEKERRQNEDSGMPGGIRNLLCFVFFLAGAVTLAGLFLVEGGTLRIFLGVFTALFWISGFSIGLIFRTGGKDDRESAAGTGESCPPELPREISSKEEAYRKIQDELEILYQRHARPEGEDTEIAALTLAIDRICEISDRIYQANGGRINEIASEILSEITGGRYDRIVMDDTLEVRIHTPSRVLGLNQVSGGTMQQVYFALRMAAGTLLAKDTALPVILDETFAMYDDRRLEATLSWLKQNGRQVILFTCQNREREMIKRL